MDVGGGLELVGREAAVAGAHGQTVGLAHDRAGDDFGKDAALGAHLADDGNLLVVLLPEVGLVRTHPFEQTTHDDTHTVEMSWAGGAFHHVGHGAEVIDLGGRDGEDLLHSGRKHVIGKVANQLHVGLQGAGILLQVLGIVELHGIHENGAEHHIVLLVCAADEREMPLVESTHGWHHTDGLTCGTLAHGNLHQFLNSFDDFHIGLKFNYLQMNIALQKAVAKVYFFLIYVNLLFWLLAFSFWL